MATETDTKYDVAVDAGVIETTENYHTLLAETQLSSDIAIAVPSKLGEVFKKKFELAYKYQSTKHEDWKKSIEAFVADGSIDDYETNGYAKENFVRWVAQTLLDYTYMQNPTIDFGATEDSEADFANALSATITSIVNKANGLGLNLKPYMLKLILISFLTNFGVMKLVYRPMKGSREEALTLYNKAIEEFDKDDNEPEDLQQLQALMDRLFAELQTREDFGMSVKIVSPFNFFVDPSGTMKDLSDHKTTFEIEDIDEETLKTTYMQYEEETKTWFFKQNTNVKYEGAVIAKENQATLQEKIIDEIMPEASDEEREAVTTGKVRCLWVHDRTTRRVYLYIKDRWDTPLWVFDDELQLSRFFPYFILSFSETMRGIITNGEVSYIVGLQNEVNETNANWKAIRNVAFRVFTYNSDAIDKVEVDKIFDEASKNRRNLTAIGVKLKDPEAKLDDALRPLLLPAAQAQPLFDNSKYEQAISRASRLTAAMQAQEFKTNTTNLAVETYQSQLSSRVNTFMDPIEEMIAQLGWAIAEIVVSLIDKNALTTLVPREKAQAIRTLSVADFNSKFTLTVEAGSMEKPNSQNNKEEALKILQLLGQFGTAAPQTVLGLVMKMLRKVFSRSLITDSDLKTLKAEGEAFMQKGVSTAQQTGAQANPQTPPQQKGQPQ